MNRRVVIKCSYPRAPESATLPNGIDPLIWWRKRDEDNQDKGQGNKKHCWQRNAPASVPSELTNVSPLLVTNYSIPGHNQNIYFYTGLFWMILTKVSSPRRVPTLRKKLRGMTVVLIATSWLLPPWSLVVDVL